MVDFSELFVGSGIFESGNPEARPKTVLTATRNWQAIAAVTEAMVGINVGDLTAPYRPAERGW